MRKPWPPHRGASEDYLRGDFGAWLCLKNLHDLFEGMHIDGVVIGRAPELPLLRSRRVPQGYAQAATDAQVRAHSADHPPVAIRLFDYAIGDWTSRLTDRARKGTKTAVGIDDRNRLRGLLARPTHHLGPHEDDYTVGGSGSPAIAQ